MCRVLKRYRVFSAVAELSNAVADGRGVGWGCARAGGARRPPRRQGRRPAPDGQVLTAVGSLGAAVSARSRPLRLASAAALLAASACTRFGVFYAGVASAEDPAAIEPQRARLARGDAARA